MMDGHRGRGSKWHQRSQQAYGDTGTPHFQNIPPSGTRDDANTPSLDQFLSGINAERKRQEGPNRSNDVTQRVTKKTLPVTSHHKDPLRFGPSSSSSLHLGPSHREPTFKDEPVQQKAFCGISRDQTPHGVPHQSNHWEMRSSEDHQNKVNVRRPSDPRIRNNSSPHLPGAAEPGEARHSFSRSVDMRHFVGQLYQGKPNTSASSREVPQHPAPSLSNPNMLSRSTSDIFYPLHSTTQAHDFQTSQFTPERQSEHQDVDVRSSFRPHHSRPHTSGPPYSVSHRPPHQPGPNTSRPSASEPHFYGPPTYGVHSFQTKPSGPHPSGPHPSGPHPSGPHPSGPHPSGPHPSGPHPSGPHPSGPHPSGPHPSGPHPSGPHPSGPHPSGPSGWHPPGLHLPGPHPSGPHPSGPHPSGPHPYGPLQSSKYTFPGHLNEPPAALLGPSTQIQGQHEKGSNFSETHPMPGLDEPPTHLEPQRSNLFPSMPNQANHNPPTSSPFFDGPVYQAPPSIDQTNYPRFPVQNSQQRHEKSQRDKDEEWLKGWLRKNKIGPSEGQTTATHKCIRIQEGRQLVRDLLQALNQLEEQKELLSRHIHKDESTWQYECRRANRTKERIKTLQATLFSEEVACQLEKKMLKTRKKRTQLKRRRLEQYQKQQDDEVRRKEIHQRIDAELAKRLQAKQEEKREAELQEEVDKTLYEVRRKKQEASQMLELIKGLRKLRQLRKDAAQAKGVQIPSTSDVTFEEKLKPFEEMMSKRSILYREEERVMQVMLEEEHEEYKEQEKARQRKRLEEKTNKEIRAKMKLLFGKDDLVGPDNPMYPFQQFYNQAANNLHSLVEIRHRWDQFLVPDSDPSGSAVPVSWVLPSDSSSPAWEAMLDT